MYIIITPGHGVIETKEKKLHERVTFLVLLNRSVFGMNVNLNPLNVPVTNLTS